MAQEILIESIRTDGAVQSRVAINAEYVAELAEQINAGVKLPPVDVYRDGDETWMADGFHRLRAHKAAGKRSIKATIHKGGKTDAGWHSCGSNKDHGLRRTNADKQRAVKMALECKPTASDRLIAEHIGVSPQSIANERRRCQTLAPERTGKDGKTYRVPPPPPSRPAPPQASRTPPPPPTPQPAARPQPPRPPDVRKDEHGRVIPDYLAGQWDRAEAWLSETVSELQRIRRLVNNDAEDSAPMLVERNHQSIVAALETALSGVKACIPYAVCPYCLAREPMQDGCNACNGAGYVGKFRYDKAIPDNVKGAP